MSKIDYEWMDKEGVFHKRLTPDMYEKYSFMTPEEVSKYKKGICVDQTEFERDWFDKNQYEYQVLVIQIKRKNDRPGHVFLIYKDNNKICWFENAWGSERGIHRYNSYDELINDIKQKFIIQNNIMNNELGKIEIFESIQYPYHLSYKEMDEYNSKNK